MKWIRESRPRAVAATLTVSLALNVIFVLGLLQATKEGASQGSAAPPAPTSGPALPNFRKPNQPPVHVVAGSPRLNFQWSDIESHDYAEYVANLRAVGCPEQVIRDLIYADLEKHYRPRRDAIESQWRRPYWQATEEGAVASERLQQRLELRAEEGTVWQDLFGEEWPVSADVARDLEVSPAELHLAFLTVEKRQAVVRALQLAPERVERAGAEVAVSEAEVRGIEEQRLAILAPILDPVELEEFDLRTSAIAQRLRRESVAATLTAEEFVKVVEARAAALAAYPSDGQLTERRAREMELVKESLGPTRSAMFERAIDPAYVGAWQIARRDRLPVTAAAGVYDVKRSAEAAAEEVRANRDLDADRRKALLLAIQREAEKSVRLALGQTGYTTYRRMGGDWLSSLSR